MHSDEIPLIRESESWKPIPGFEGRYDASSFGRIRSYQRHRFNEVIPHILVPCERKKGYLQLCLLKGGKQYSCAVHRLVAMTFIPNPENKPQVNHIDLNKRNNNIGNLEWCDGKENIRHARRNGIVFNRNASKAISKPVQCLETKTVFQSARDAARKMNLSYVGIGKVCLGKCKTTRGYHFRFMENLNVH